MHWYRLIGQGIAPAVAVGIIAASVLSAVTTKSALPPGFDARAGGVTSATQELWNAGASKLEAPVDISLLQDAADPRGGVWVETTMLQTLIGTSYGKLVVTRDFGPSEDADAHDIIRQPDAHVVAVSMAFHPFGGGQQSGIRARFAPDGALIETAEITPSPGDFAEISTAQCSAPTAEERAARS